MGGQGDPVFPSPAPTTCPNGDSVPCVETTTSIPGNGGGSGGNGDEPPESKCPPAGDVDGEGQGTVGRPGMRLGATAAPMPMSRAW